MSGLIALAVVAVACGGGPESPSNGDNGVTVRPITQTPPIGSTSTPGTPTAASGGNGAVATQPPSSNGLTGFIMPIQGGCMPRGPQLLPNAPRPYRNGVHEGLDLYGSDNCVSITRGTPVLAAKPGRVIRADLDYQELTAAQLQADLANPNTDEALDRFRGRQVWIDHGGVVTRYAHLSGIAPGITVGASVNAGQVVAYVGESGTPESVNSPGTEYHLHFEVRIGSGFLGQGQSEAEVRRLYQQLFTP